MRRRLTEAARARRAIETFDRHYGAGGRGEPGTLLLESRGRREEALRRRADEAARRCEGVRDERRREEVVKRYVRAATAEGYTAQEAAGAIKDAWRGLRAKRRADEGARREDEAKRPFGGEPKSTAPDWGRDEDEGVRSLGDDDDADDDSDEDDSDEEGY